MINRDLIIETLSDSAVVVQPYGRSVHCYDRHIMDTIVRQAGLEYQLCHRCGAIQIMERR